MKKEMTLSEVIFARLSERIISGELAAGSPLRQDHIAAEFQASHVPVREAFRELEARGLAQRLPRRGTRVAEVPGGALREVAEMRAVLEPLALRHAAPQITGAVLQRAADANQEAENADDIYAWEDANRRFHRSLLEPCGMDRLLRSIDDLHLASARFLFAGKSREWQSPSDRDHRAILAALRAGDSASACSILARHVQWTHPRLRLQGSGFNPRNPL
ncbi:GntR family transcriptional regulator [Falsigemmobacter faecalis]|uniref:GntR family transcriptional regulator n=1 Tax=Falsigemmobacter faecalis TaxID=2488730 RepID=A0A3P3DKY5_9RHOB|nr:GntR family transcriptional regulator [Falsigemmobacter faecalis]RRH74272.1 GntR family transcriptional regulator [Falsigemmobacter faecalis]